MPHYLRSLLVPNVEIKYGIDLDFQSHECTQVICNIFPQRNSLSKGHYSPPFTRITLSDILQTELKSYHECGLKRLHEATLCC